MPLDQIQRAKTHGVTIDYIRDLKAQGFRSATLEIWCGRAITGSPATSSRR